MLEAAQNSYAIGSKNVQFIIVRGIHFILAIMWISELIILILMGV